MEVKPSEPAVSHIEVAGMSVGRYSSLEQTENSRLGTDTRHGLFLL
jgi:hypothetical protein